MLEKLKNALKNNKVTNALIGGVYRFVRSVLIIPKQFQLYNDTKKAICDVCGKKRIYYIGIPAHNNLGDLAQGMCIRRWLKKNYPERQVVEIETNSLVNTKFSALKTLKKAYRHDDFIVFQSGYTTTDLGGHADEMHCAVIRLLPNARILMMPQTIFFKSQKRKQHTSQVYNSAKNMLFLARDRVSYDMAREMFEDIPVLEYPDIVTTLIGNKMCETLRDGILFCCRDDGEKLYSDDEIAALMEKCSQFAKVEKTDTTKHIKASDIVNNAEQYIMAEIENYSNYKLLITDRYHGTIFSLVAGTPVIIIKTTDHKVTTGAQWFKGVYDDYVYTAESLEQAYELAKKIYAEPCEHKMQPYFENKYYDKLPEIFEEQIGK